MNQRIRELAEQAKKYALDAMIKITDKEQALKVYSASYDTKFAELIVRECMACSTWVGKMNNYAIEPVHTAHTINQRMKEHFGVEE
jgi:hypothetical protein